jgi:hypothetical protein
MMLVNGVSRFDLVGRTLRAVEEAGAAAGAGEEERVNGLDVKGLLGEVERRVQEVKRFIVEHGKGEFIWIFYTTQARFGRLRSDEANMHHRPG